jgi:plasmid maintenance system antidote protein VapI
MKSIAEMRRNNLSILIDEAGGRIAFTDKALARDLKIEYGYVGQLVNQSRGIGNSVARKLELIGNKPTNWLDHPYYNLWLDNKLITEADIPNADILKDISYHLGIQEPKENYRSNHTNQPNSDLEKTSVAHHNEIEKLINKIEFIFSKENNEKDIEVIKQIVDMVFNKNQNQ